MAEREKNGRFAKGNAGGPGNPFAARVAKLRAVLLACLDEETMRVVVQAMIRQAMRGDVAAAKLLFQYALGKPIEVPLPETAEEDEDAVNKREETEGEEQPSAVNKREETEGEEQPSAVNKRERTAAQSVNKRRETGERRTSDAVNKREETGGSATESATMTFEQRQSVWAMLEEMFGIPMGPRGEGVTVPGAVT